MGDVMSNWKILLIAVAMGFIGGFSFIAMAKAAAPADQLAVDQPAA